MAHDKGPTHYEVLGVDADASAEAIRQAYRVKAKLAHPDAGGDPASFRRVFDAYQVLNNPARRRAYDDDVGIGQAYSHSEGVYRGGWTGTRGDFTGSVDFPDYLRTFTDAPWRPPAEEPAFVTDDGVDPTGAAGPADIVWWWPDQAVAPPVSAGPLLLVAGAGSVVALSVLTGHEAWRADLGSRPTGPALVIDDTVVVWTENGVVHGLELGRGVTRWELSTGVPGPGGLADGGGTIIAARADAKVVGIDPITGKGTWGVKLSATATGPLAVAGAMVVAMTRSTVEGFEAHRGRFRWRIPLRAPIALPPCAVGSGVWLAGGGGSGSVTRIDAATGAVSGTYRTGSAIAGLATDGTLLFASVAGPPRLVALDRDGRLFLSADLPNVCPEPALDEAYAYLADPTGRLLTVDRLRRRVAAVVTLPFEPIGAPCVVGERLIVLARDGHVWATALPTP